MNIRSIAAIIMIGFLTWQCQNTPAVTENIGKSPAVSGIIYQPDGSTPAVGAKVMIRPADALATPSAAVLEKRLSSNATVFTGEDGTFFFDTSFTAGTYLIEAMQDDDIVKIDSIGIISSNAPVTIPPATLLPAGSIQGSILLPKDRDPRNVFVLVFGIDRFAQVNNDGTFIFTGLGAGIYSIRIVSSMEEFGTIDMTGITVTSADTTDLGSIILPLDALPVPQNLSTTFDKASHSAVITWNKCDVPEVIGYAVYRRFADSSQTFKDSVNLWSVDDTQFVDKSVNAGLRYEYRVATLGSNGTGLKSSSSVITPISPFSIDTAINLFFTNSEIGDIKTIYDMAAAENGDLYFPDPQDSCVIVFDRDMRLKQRIGKDQRIIPFAVEVDEHGMIFIEAGSIFYLYDSTGIFIDSIADSTLMHESVERFAVKDSRIYCLTHSQKFFIYTFAGEQIRSWQYNGPKKAGIFYKGNDEKIYVTDNAPGTDETLSEVVVFDTLGTILTEITVPECGGEYERIFSIAYDDINNRLYVAFNDLSENFGFSDACVIKVIDDGGAVIATYKNSENNGLMTLEANLCLLSNGELVFHYGNMGYPELIRFKPLD